MGHIRKREDLCQAWAVFAAEEERFPAIATISDNQIVDSVMVEIAGDCRDRSLPAGTDASTGAQVREEREVV